MDENQQAAKPAQEAKSVEDLVKGMLAQGLGAEEAAEALRELAEQGKIGEDDLAAGLELLEKGRADEQAGAEKLFGMKFIGQ